VADDPVYESGVIQVFKRLGNYYFRGETRGETVWWPFAIPAEGRSPQEALDEALKINKEIEQPRR